MVWPACLKSPEIDVPSMEQQAELNRLAQALQDVDAAIREKAPQLAAARPAWEKSLKDIASAWQTLGVTDARDERRRIGGGRALHDAAAKPSGEEEAAGDREEPVAGSLAAARPSRSFEVGLHGCHANCIG